MSSIENEKIPIPFFVVDRPASLRIIKGSDLISFDIQVGLMSHANTSNRFQSLFKSYPCSDKEFCDIIGSKCPFQKKISKCSKGLKIKKQTIKMCDSGVFTKEGCTKIDYQDLFKTYQNMDARYGFIMDVLKDKEATIETAKEAMIIYKKRKWSFDLIGVSQGNSIEEYISCYDELKSIGYKHIAIGGLLKKYERSARFVSVRNDNFMYTVLREIRKKNPNDWLFVLGSYHPKRHQKFKYLNVYGGDYKGWIFHYTPAENVSKRKAQKHRFNQVRSYLKNEIYPRVEGSIRPNKLLILGCSNRKDANRNLIPAFERYDGPIYRIFRKHFFDGLRGDIDTYIISAKHGLIGAETPIHNYDTIMNKTTALRMKQVILDKIKLLSRSREYIKIFIALGKTYLLSIDGMEEIFTKSTKIEYAEGKIGEKGRTLKEWLRSL